MIYCINKYMSSFTTTGIVSATPTHPSIGWNNSWVVVENNANRELYAQAMYVTNLDDIQISLSAGDIKVDAASAVLITNPVTAVEVLNPLTSVSISNEVEIYTSQTLSVSGSVTILNPVTSIEVTVDQVTISNPVTAVTILNPVTSIEVVVDQVTVSNPVTAVTVLNPVTSIEVNIDQVTISNPVTAVIVSNPVTAVEIHTDQILSVSGSVTILNPVTSIDVTVSNPVSAVTILNPVTSFSVDIENVTVSNPVTAVMILNQSAIVVTTETPGQVYAFNNHATFEHRGWVMDSTMRPVVSLKLSTSSNITDLMNIIDYQIVINASNGSTATVIYEWWEGDILISGSSVPSWSGIGEYSQYRVYQDQHSNNTGNTFSSNGAILRHSGILINHNTESDSVPINLYGGATANVATLCIKRVDTNTDLDVWFSINIKELA